MEDDENNFVYLITDQEDVLVCHIIFKSLFKAIQYADSKNWDWNMKGIEKNFDYKNDDFDRRVSILRLRVE